MRRSRLLSASLLAAALVGCGGGGKHHGDASTAAPITTGSTGPITSGSIGPVNTGTQPPPPPASTLLASSLVSSFALDSLSEVDARTGTMTSSWAVGDGPTDVAHRLNEAYVTNALSQDVTIVDRLA